MLTVLLVQFIPIFYITCMRNNTKFRNYGSISVINTNLQQNKQVMEQQSLSIPGLK